AEGVGIIYISNKMEEILNISDDVTIMRDGEWIATETAKDLNINRIIQLMVGRSLENRYLDKKHVHEVTMMELIIITGMYEPTVKDASFTLRKGVVLGIS